MASSTWKDTAAWTSPHQPASRRAVFSVWRILLSFIGRPLTSFSAIKMVASLTVTVVRFTMSKWVREKASSYAS
eukprot:6578148-Pyramimonas_sp.AAC.1